MRPNLFDYATSELSQDAFLLWLIEWGQSCYKDEDNALHAIAQRFIRRLLNKSKEFEISDIQLFKQQKKIDVLAIINNQYAIIIEDKTDTREHDRQISAYTKEVQTQYPALSLTCVYYKSGNESKQSIRNMNKTYKQNHPDAADILVLSRKEMIDILTSEECHNEILTGYLSKLQQIEKATNSYRTKPVNEWGWRAWQGFYMMLEEYFDTDLNFGWGNVPQKDGGFQGCWFCFHPIPDMEKSKLYIQIEGAPKSIENTKICFKICHIPNQSIDACREWSHKVINLAHERGYSQVTKLISRFKKGEYMTIAGISGSDFFGEGIVDFDKVTLLLSDYCFIVKKLTMKTCELYEKPFKVKSLCKEAVCEFMLCFLRKSSPYYCIEHLDRDANIHQDADGFWIGEINDIWDTDKEDREWEWERAMSDLRSIWIDGEQTEVKYLSL